VQNGIVPNPNPENSEDFDASVYFVTYSVFAEVMQNLLSYQIDEKYTFNSGHMPIRRHEAESILAKAMAKTPPQGSQNAQNIQSALSYQALFQMLDNSIQLFISSENISNLRNTPLNGTLIVNQSAPNDTILANVTGSGDIIIVPKGTHILLDTINISGNIIIAGAGENGGTKTPTDITIRNTVSPALLVMSDANVTLIGNTRIRSVNLAASCVLNTTALAINPPNVIINNEDIALIGSFNEAESRLTRVNGPVVITAEGHIARLISAADTILIGDVDVRNHDLPGNTELKIIKQEELYSKEALKDTIESVIEAAMSRHMKDLTELITDMRMPNTAPDPEPSTSGAPENTNTVPTPPQITPPSADPPRAPETPSQPQQQPPFPPPPPPGSMFEPD
jgi:hypothetical protein